MASGRDIVAALKKALAEDVSIDDVCPEWDQDLQKELNEIISIVRCQQGKAQEEYRMLESLNRELMIMADNRAKASREISARAEEVLHVVLALARRDFDQRVNVGDDATPIDMVAMAINLLAEELKVATVDKAYVDQILDAMPDILLAVDRNFNITSLNQTVQKTLGYSEHELINQPLRTLLADSHDKLVQHLNVSEPVRDLSIEISAKNGELIPVSASGAVMQDVDGEIAGAVIVVTDVRELTKTHRKLKETQAQLVQAGKMIAIGQLAGAVAHEINNPLAAILLSADCLAEDLKYANPPREFSSWPTFVNRIRLGVERCQRVTLSLLDFAHQSPSTSDRLDLCQVVERTLALGVAPPLIRDCVVSPDPPDWSDVAAGNGAHCWAPS